MPGSIPFEYSCLGSLACFDYNDCYITWGGEMPLSGTLQLKGLRCELEDRILFSELDFTLAPGEIVHLIGPNGAGKTTLLRIVTGLFDHFEGDIEWGGQLARGYDFLSSLLFIGHHTGVKSSLTPLENLSWYFGMHGRKSPGESSHQCVTKQELIDALAKVQLAGYEDIPCYQLSAGQQRRVALARLYVSSAPLWVLDEPFTAIDVQGVAQLEACLIAHAERGGCVLLTTHQAPSFDKLKVLDLAHYVPKRVEQ